MGVFPLLTTEPDKPRGLPHAGGGVSIIKGWLPGLLGSSPRRWGCFRLRTNKDDIGTVFPTPVGVFPRSRGSIWGLIGLPHAGGGVSKALLDLLAKTKSSPRRWGCFHPQYFGRLEHKVFPTPVGVFLSSDSRIWMASRLPHAGGGVSSWTRATTCTTASSPRRWGCFWN